MAKQSNRLRDVRKPGWFWAQNELIERDGAELGPYGIAVYCVLAKMAGDRHMADPAVPTIARKIGCSTNKAREALKKLEELGWIKIRPRGQEYANGKKRQLTNEYLLLNNGTPPHVGGTPQDEVGTAPGEGGTSPGGDEEEAFKKEPLEEMGRHVPENPIDAEVVIAWHSAYDEFIRQYPREVYDRHFRHLRLVSTENGTLTVAAVDEQSREWLALRLDKSLRRTLKRLAGRDVEVKYEVTNGKQT